MWFRIPQGSAQADIGYIMHVYTNYNTPLVLKKSLLHNLAFEFQLIFGVPFQLSTSTLTPFPQL